MRNKELKNKAGNAAGQVSTEPARLTGTVGIDWLRKKGIDSGIAEGLLRDWRDYLEGQLRRQGLDPDLNVSSETRFTFWGAANSHSIIEIESAARRMLDVFLHERDRS